MNSQHAIKPVKLNMIDRVVNIVNPSGGLKRARARAQLQNLSSNGYITYGSNKNSMRGAFASPNSADVDIIPKLEDMRATSRDMYMNAPIATAVLKRARTSIVGYGLSLQPRIDRKLLGLTDEQAVEWEQSMKREFNLIAQSKEIDAARTLNFYDLQWLALFSTMLNGDCFIMMPSIPRKNVPYNLRIKIIEADCVSNPNAAMDTDKIAGGVEVDSDGAPVAYHIRRTHPGSYMPSWDWDRIPVYGESSGRRNVLHLFTKDRAGQRRGVPLLAPVFEALKMITRLSEAELMAAVVTSFYTAFIETESPDEMLALSIPDSEKVTDSANNASDLNKYEMGSGSMIGLAPGEKVNLADPKRPNALFEPFFNAIVTQIGAATEFPAEQIMLKFNTSYTAAKGALNEAWKFTISERIWLERELCMPVYEEIAVEAILAGRISAPGFFLDPLIRQAWLGSKWYGPGQGQLNPVQETTASLMKVKGNLSTHSKEVAAIDGDDFDTMIHNRSNEEKLLEELRLTSISKGMITPSLNDGASSATQSTDSTDNQDSPTKPSAPAEGVEEDTDE
jgi:lambda family phage portal protein